MERILHRWEGGGSIKMTKFSILSVACVVAAQGGFACGNDADNDPMAGAGGNAGIAGAPAGGSTGVAGAATANGGAFLTQVEGLSDAEMLNVLEIASVGEIRRGHIADDKAQNAAVRTFASKLVRDYTIIGYSAAVTAKTMGVTPSTSEAASMVTRAGDAVTVGMTTMPGSVAFDRRYMDVQIDADKGMLALVERMLAHADAVPLRTLLIETLEAAQGHLGDAALIRLTLD